jgi:hypothetical protein
MLDPSFSFDFVDGPFSSEPAADIALFYSPPYYSFWEGSEIKDIRASHKWLEEKIKSDGPYDGVITFSQGCAVIASFLLYHQAETPHVPPPFKVAVFICGGLPLQVLEDVGVTVSLESYYWDNRTRQELEEKARMINTMMPGDVRWESPKDIDPSAPLDLKNVFGLDITKVPDNLRIKIPTAHIYGFKDPRYISGVQLSQLCNPAVRKCYDHGGGHEIPRGQRVSENIAEILKWSALIAGC